MLQNKKILRRISAAAATPPARLSAGHLPLRGGFGAHINDNLRFCGSVCKGDNGLSQLFCGQESLGVGVPGGTDLYQQSAGA